MAKRRMNAEEVGADIIHRLCRVARESCDWYSIAKERARGVFRDAWDRLA